MGKCLGWVLGMGLGVFFLGACGPGTGGDIENASQSCPIFYGTPDDNPAHAAVVSLTKGQGWGSYCSGTLISPEVVLTAAHCLEILNQPADVQIFFGNDISAAGTYVDVAEYLIHPDYDDLDIVDDLGLIRLATAAPAGVVPISALPAVLGLTAADHGGAVEFSGFGLTETGTDGVKLRVDGVIEEVCAGPDACPSGSPWISPRAFGYYMAGGGPCSGDSGGPTFILRSGTEYVAGVTSYGDEPCTDYGVNGMVDAYDVWIQDFISGAHAENCAVPGDEDQDGLSDCDDPDCDRHPACQGADACVMAGVLACGDLLTGNTGDGPIIFGDYSCMLDGSMDGPELAYAIDLPAGTLVDAVLTPTGAADLDLFLVPAAGDGCNPAGCIDLSIEYNPDPDRIEFLMPANGVYLVVETWDMTGPFSLELSCSEHCDSGSDEDGDGLIDCDDPDCADACKKKGGGCSCAVAASPAGFGWLVMIGLILLRRGRSRP
jgi:MYXO-CTERM domain-containing protein